MAGRSGIYSSLAIAAVLFGAVAVLVVFQSRVPERHDETPVPIKESNGQPPDVVPDSTPSTNLTPPKSESHTSDQTVEPSRRQLNGVVREEQSAEPVAGATVSFAFNAPDSALQPNMWLDTVTTDSNGTFDFGTVVERAYRIHAFSTEHSLTVIRGAYPGNALEVLIRRDVGIQATVKVERVEGAVPLPGQPVLLAIPETGWVFEATTDDQGEFSIPGVDVNEIDSADEFVIVVAGYGESSYDLIEDSNESRLAIAVEPGILLTGAVIDAATGNPIPGATISSESGHSVVSDADGTYSIGGVLSAISARAPGYTVHFEEIDDIDGYDDVDAEETGASLFLDLRLGRGVTVHGRVLNQQGKPLAGIRVGLDPFDLDIAVEDDPRLAMALANELSSTSDANGRYRLQALSPEVLDLPGPLDLQVRPRGNSAGVTDQLHVDEGVTIVDHNIVLQIESVLRCAVTDASGAPVSGATIVAELVDDDLYQFVSTDRKGHCTFQNMIHGRYRVAVLIDDNPLLIQDVVVPSESLQLQLETARRVAGRVVSEGDGNPLAGFRTNIVFKRGGIKLERETTTDEQGSFLFDGVPPGEFLLEVWHPLPAPRFNPLPRFHEQEIVIEGHDWNEIIEFPQIASGWVEMVFVIRQSDGTLQPVDAPVEVSVVAFGVLTSRMMNRFTGGSSKQGMTSKPLRRARLARPFAMGEFVDVFRRQLRSGDYTFRATARIEGRRLSRDVNVEIRTEQTSPHEVEFLLRR